MSCNLSQNAILVFIFLLKKSDVKVMIMSFLLGSVQNNHPSLCLGYDM